VSSERSSAVGFWGAGFVLLILISVLLVGGRNEDPFDPRSVSPQGAKALVDLAESFGSNIDIGVNLPDASHDVALLLEDTYGLADRRALETWADGGGTVVVADISSALSPRVVFDNGGSQTPCQVGALDQVVSLSGTDGRYLPPSNGELCAGGAIAVVGVGSGVIVSIAGPGPLLNEHLVEADNAVLAVALLAPVDGTSVAFLVPALPLGAGGERIWDLIADPIWILLIQSGVAFLFFGWWRAHRLGEPVAEPVTVQIEGSELAVARGRLLAGLRQPAAAAPALRSDAKRRLTRRMGLPVDAPTAVLAERVALTTSLSEGHVVQLLETQVVATDADLVALATGLAELRSAALDTHQTSNPGD